MINLLLPLTLLIASPRAECTDTVLGQHSNLYQLDIGVVDYYPPSKSIRIDVFIYQISSSPTVEGVFLINKETGATEHTRMIDGTGRVNYLLYDITRNDAYSLVITIGEVGEVYCNVCISYGKPIREF